MLTARKKERQLLLDTLAADESKLVAVYGRRRVGKTYLVRESFGRRFTFQHSGYANGSTAEQLFAFCVSLREYGLEGFEQPKNWLAAFELLKDVIRSSNDEKKVVFIDELSWMDTPRSDLMLALEGFWNGWASARTDVVLILCASATSWMLNKVIHNKGGLYNRLSFQIKLKPFTLGECEQYASERGLALTRYQLLELYMAMGGVAYYWSFLKKGLSVAQNIDALFFASGAPLADEFGHLYASLFKKPEPYVAIINALGRHGHGMTRKQLLKELGTKNSGGFSTKLGELESCGFIRSYREFGKKSQGTVYQLIDNFTLFYFKFLRRRPTDEHFWENNARSGARNAWCGIAFERVCLEHLPQMKQALGISGVSTEANAWSCEANPELGVNGSQIDLLIVRRDQIINLCEMKYAQSEYAVTKEADEALRHKLSDFMTLAKTKSAVHVTLVAPYGLKQNAYAGNIQSSIAANDLFAQ